MAILSEHVGGERKNFARRLSSLGVTKKTYAGALVVLVLLVSTVVVGQSIQRQRLERSQAAAPDVVISDELLAKAQIQGKVQVIIRLADAHTSEQSLDQNGKNQQRIRHKQAQDSLSGQFNSSTFKVGHKLEGIPLMSAEVSYDDLVRLKTMKGPVLKVVEDVPMVVNLATSAPQIGAPFAYDLGYDGTGQTIAVIDSGVDKNHPFLQRPSGGSKVVAEHCFAGGLLDCPNGANEQDGPGSATPCTGVSPEDAAICAHGTAVAGVAAGAFNGTYSGIAKGADLVAIRVTNPIDTTQPNSAVLCGNKPLPCVVVSSSDVLAALNWVNSVGVPTYGVDVVNISIAAGKAFSDITSCETDPNGLGGEFSELILGLSVQNVPVVVGAGNDGFIDKITVPACTVAAIAAGALSDAGNILSISNAGAFKATSLFFAPGESVNSSVPGGGYDNNWGTSFAAPHVAGAFAIMKQARPDATYNDILTALREGSDIVSDAPRSGYTNYYKLNLERSLALLFNPTIASKALSFSYPVKSGNNRVLIVSAAYQHGSVSDLNNTRLTGVTYGGQAMQPLFAISPSAPRANVSSHTDPSGVTRSTEIWYLLNPPVGTQQVNATFGADPGEKNIMATTLFNVDFTSPFGIPGKSSAGSLNPNSVGFPGNGYGIGNIGSADLPGCDTTAKCKILGVYATDLSNGTNAARAATADETFTKKPISGLYSKQTFSAGAGETGKLGVFLATSEGIDKTTSSGDAIQTLLRTPKTLGFSAVGFFWKESKTASTPVPTPTPTPTGGSTLKGWTASYYPNTTFSGSSNSIDNIIGYPLNVNFDWSSTNPVGKYGLNSSLTFPSDNFSANFIGRIKPTVGGTYSFKTDTDNTAVFTITNQSGTQTTVINGGGIRTASYAMTAGQIYSLSVKYTELTGNAKMKLFWKVPGTTYFVPIPSESMEPVDNSNTTYSVVGLPPQNSCEHTVRFVNKPNDGIQNVMDVDAVIENYVVIEEDSPRMKRDSAATWTLSCGGAASGDCLYFTRNNGLGFEFKTKAQKITYLGRRGDKQGSMQVYVDGVLKGTYNRYATSYVGQQPIDVSLLNLACPTSSTPTTTPAPTAAPTIAPTPAPTSTPTASSGINPTADASVRATEASTNFGTRTTLDVGGSPQNLSYFKFSLAGLSGSSISSAKLRVRVYNGSTSIQSVKEVSSTSWSETGLTYNNRPAVGSVIATNNGGVAGEWKEIDITNFVKSKAGSTISLAIDQTGGDGFAMYSRESTDKPSIIINGGGTAPAPTPTPTPTPAPNAPVVNLLANGSGGPVTVAAGGSVTLSWSTSNATSCTASATVATTNWSGTKAASGVQSVSVSASTTFTLTCTGAGGAASDSVVVNTGSTSSYNVILKNIPDPATFNDLLLLNSVTLGGTTYQETSSIFSYSGSWTTVTGAKYTTNSASVSFTTNQSTMTLLTSRGPTRSSRVEVYVNGVLKQVLNLNYSTTQNYTVSIPLN